MGSESEADVGALGSMEGIGKGVVVAVSGKDRDVLFTARSQNSWARDCAESCSFGQTSSMQATIWEVNNSVAFVDPQ